MYEHNMFFFAMVSIYPFNARAAGRTSLDYRYYIGMMPRVRYYRVMNWMAAGTTGPRAACRLPVCAGQYWCTLPSALVETSARVGSFI
jgi:hypothetical protein